MLPGLKKKRTERKSSFLFFSLQPFLLFGVFFSAYSFVVVVSFFHVEAQVLGCQSHTLILNYA